MISKLKQTDSKDCFRTTLACLLGYTQDQVESIPDFSKSDNFHQDVQDYLSKIGKTFIVVNTPHIPVGPTPGGSGYFTVSGLSYITEQPHIQIFKDGEFYHDVSNNDEGQVLPFDVHDKNRSPYYQLGYLFDA